ncbi:MAG: nuclear transport factor 2 family protein [Marinilabiliaceae bacterium]|nr:nuclear transport factor 2 family protein [Marinilabiliaceae bacterium]
MKSTAINTKDSQRIAEIESVLNKLLRSQEKGDINDFADCFAQDENFVTIGTDIDEIWYDWPTFFSWMKSAITKWQGYSITEKNTRITMSNNGQVAWYSQLMDTCFETKGEPVRLEGFRHTGVVEYRNGKWLIVQSHISIPYIEPDEEEEASNDLLI